jgi:anti-sigma B factor antagonist
MELTTTQYKRCDVVKPIGRIDGSTAPQLEEAISTLTENGRYKIVVDMSDVDFMSSAGWWTLIRAQKVCRRYKRGEVVLACVSEKIRSSLELVGMGNYFSSYGDLTSAVGNF